MNEIFVKKVCSGSVIFREGEKGDCMYHLRSGKVGIYSRYGKRNEKLLALVSAEDASPYFGEMALVDASPRSATAVALENCEIGEVPEHALRFYAQQHPELVFGMLSRMSERIRALTDNYMDACRTIAQQQAEKSAAGSVEKYTALLAEEPTEVELAALTAPTHETGSRPAAFSGSAAVMEAGRFPAGTVLFREGDVELRMYELMSGSVAIYADYGLPTQKKLTTLTPDNSRFLGEMGLIDGVARSATAVAETDCTLLTIDGAQANRYFSEEPRLLLALMRQMSGRIRSLTGDYMEALKTIQASEKCREGSAAPEWLSGSLKKFAGFWADFGHLSGHHI